jgi:hypothetical protein
MAPFDMLSKIFRTALAESSDLETEDMLQFINIELDELDHHGRRSTEKNRKRRLNKTITVCSPFRTEERRLNIS